MPHIHTEPHQHDHTVSAFIINTTDNTLLLHQHKIMKIWLQPGGHVELHENPWQTMQHELEEETGYLLHQLNVLQHQKPIEGLKENVHPVPLTLRTYPFPKINHFHTDGAYGFTTTELPAQKVGEGESDTLKWFTAEMLEALTNSIEIATDTKNIGLHLLKTYATLEAIPATQFRV